METKHLNTSQRAILDLIKHRGRLAVPALASDLQLNVETVRGHVNGLVAQGLVRREGSVSEGPGRPEILFGLTETAESLFPRREADVLRRLAEYLRREGHRALLDEFFDEWMAEHREAAMDRLEGLSGPERLAEVAGILSELGFMAVVDDDGRGGAAPLLRLCHCPLRALVDATKTPCRAEEGLVKELLGTGLRRESYIPAGDDSCSYRLQPETA